MSYKIVATRGGVYRWETPLFDRVREANEYIMSLPEQWTKDDDLEYELVKSDEEADQLCY